MLSCLYWDKIQTNSQVVCVMPECTIYMYVCMPICMYVCDTCIYALQCLAVGNFKPAQNPAEQFVMHQQFSAPGPPC
jgi:hypothetical protein